MKPCEKQKEKNILFYTKHIAIYIAEEQKVVIFTLTYNLLSQDIGSYIDLKTPFT